MRHSDNPVAARIAGSQQHHEGRSMSPAATRTMGVWTAIGIAIGVAVGAGSDNIGVGIAIGAGLGAAIGTFVIERQGTEDRTPSDQPVPGERP